MASEPDEGRVADDRTVPASIADLRRDDIPAAVDQLLPLRHQLAGWAVRTGLTADQVEALILAVDEAMSNAVSHAYPDRPGTFGLHASHRPDLGTVHVTVRDLGRWREPVDRGPLHGRGLVLIRALAHEVRFEQTTDGTCVHMIWLLPEQPPASR
jgi:anti-sigma regulatory factor (Ser/Thr protein kinase)